MWLTLWVVVVFSGCPQVGAVESIVAIDFSSSNFVNELFPKGTDNEVGAVYVKLALDFYKAKEYEKACRQMGKAVLYKDTGARQLFMAKACEKNGNYTRALSYLRRARELDPLRELVPEMIRIKKQRSMVRAQQQVAAEEALRARLMAQQKTTAQNSFQEIRQEIIDFTNAAVAHGSPNMPPEAKEDVSSEIQAFIEGLTSPRAIVRSRSIRGLTDYGRPELAPHIAVLLNDDDPFMRVEAAIALGKLRSPLTVVNLLERLFVETDPTATDQIISALAKVNNAAVKAGLKKYRQNLVPSSREAKEIDEILN